MGELAEALGLVGGVLGDNKLSFAGEHVEVVADDGRDQTSAGDLLPGGAGFGFGREAVIVGDSGEADCLGDGALADVLVNAVVGDKDRCAGRAGDRCS